MSSAHSLRGMSPRRSVERAARSSLLCDPTKARDQGPPGTMARGALRALPDFRRAVWSVTAPGGRLQARSKKQSKEVGIKSISPTVSAKFHQVPGAQGKGVSWGTRGRQWRVDEKVGSRESWTRSHWGVRGGKAAAGSPACWSGAGSRLQGS